MAVGIDHVLMVDDVVGSDEAAEDGFGRRVWHRVCCSGQIKDTRRKQVDLAVYRDGSLMTSACGAIRIRKVGSNSHRLRGCGVVRAALDATI